MPPVQWTESSSAIKELTFQHTVDRFSIDQMKSTNKEA